jgi:hypothetical protein
MKCWLKDVMEARAVQLDMQAQAAIASPTFFLPRCQIRTMANTKAVRSNRRIIQEIEIYGDTSAPSVSSELSPSPSTFVPLAQTLSSDSSCAITSTMTDSDQSNDTADDGGVSTRTYGSLGLWSSGVSCIEPAVDDSISTRTYDGSLC